MNERIIKFIKDNKKNSSFYFSKKKLSKIFENPIDNLRISELKTLYAINNKVSLDWIFTGIGDMYITQDPIDDDRDSGLKERSNFYMYDNKHTYKTLGKKLGVRRETISNLLSEKSNPYINSLLPVLENFKNIDYNWLFLGLGLRPRNYIKLNNMTRSIDLGELKESHIRFKKLMGELGYSTQTEFCKNCSISPTTISSMFTKKSNMTEDTMYKLKVKHPKIDLNWLVTGMGEMFIKE